MNRGALELAKHLKEHGQLSALARELGGKTDNAMVGRWVRGLRKPGTYNRVRLEELLGIPWNAWDKKIATRSDKQTSNAA